MSSAVDTQPRIRPQVPFRASRQDGRYPRPQLVRAHWAELGGEWSFSFDDADVGLTEAWQSGFPLERSIVVPFPFESSASGIADTGHHRVLWYRRSIEEDDLASAGFGHGDVSEGARLLLHFGAVDYRCTVWLGGVHLGSHEGGHTPFTFDISEVMIRRGGGRCLDLVVRVEDDPLDVGQPRGKQDWRVEPHSIWYHRSSGIWQPVWLEACGKSAVMSAHWTPDLVAGTVAVQLGLDGRPESGTQVAIALSYDGIAVGEQVIIPTTEWVTGTIQLPAQQNGQSYEEMLWSPEHPRLIDAEIVVSVDGRVTDTVHSYLGLRSVAVEKGRFLLNDRPYFVRSVLNQGYWASSHMASPTPDSLREDVEITKALGFNATRIHQKIEDPRFLFWTDRLGLLVWGEAPGTFEFSPRSVQRTITEWTAVVERDRSHPSIVTWVPLNESWGVQHIAHNPSMRHFARTLVSLTRTLDPSRPVISNDGWEHVDSDILSIHDYESDAKVLTQRYESPDACRKLLSGFGPAGRRLLLDGHAIGERPIMLTEFGGISFAVDYVEPDAWGYSTAESPADFLARLTAIVGAVSASPTLAGYCYTQLYDTLQETNGLLTADRTPKVPLELLNAVFRGTANGHPESAP